MRFKKLLNKTLTVLTVIAVSVFATAWLNVLIPTFWMKEIMDACILGAITVRSVITFLVATIIAILIIQNLKQLTVLIWLSTLLPALAWILKTLLFLDGKGPSLAVTYPMYGIMLVWVTALWIESIIVELRNKTFSKADVIEDFLFSIALATLFYGATTVLNVQPLSGTAFAMSPVLALVQLMLSKAFHTPKKAVRSSSMPPKA